MKRLILGLCALVACSSGKGGAHTPQVSVGAYSALRWVPGKATYAITARTVREAQQGLRDVIDTFGVLGDVTVADVSRDLQSTLLVDPLSAEAAAHIGIDVDGGFAIFSESINPTVVVHLASVQAFHEFIAGNRLRTQSVVVDGTEVFTAPIPGGVRISWAIADDWLWVHFKLPIGGDDGDAWFASSRKPGSPTWSADLAWAKGGRDPAVVGFVDAAHFVADASARMPNLAACLSQLPLGAQGIGRLSLAIGGDTKQMNARVGLEVGPGVASGVASTQMPPPEGWYTSTAQVPIAAQWNLDLAVVRPKIKPCEPLLDIDLRIVDVIGLRTARAFLRSFDPDERKGTGAAALDLTHKDFFAEQLDDIPLRSTFERKRTFGPHAGKSLSIPMFLTVDYVLTDHLALAGVGDGLLAVLVGKGGTVNAPIAELAVQPLGLSAESWVELLRLAEIDNAKRVAERLQRWKEARVNLTIEGTRLVLVASGTRR